MGVSEGTWFEGVKKPVNCISCPVMKQCSAWHARPKGFEKKQARTRRLRECPAIEINGVREIQEKMSKSNDGTSAWVNIHY